MRIVYLGKKPWHTDKWFKSGTMWQGHGDVQEVPDDLGPKLLKKFPSVYAPAPADSKLPGHESGEPVARFGGGDPPPSLIDSILVPDPAADGKEVPLRTASFAAVRSYVVNRFGINVREDISRTEMLDLVVELLEAGKEPVGEAPPPDKPPAEDPPPPADETPPPPPADDKPPPADEKPPANDPPPPADEAPAGDGAPAGADPAGEGGDGGPPATAA